MTKILIVDDSPAEVRLMQSVLDRAGYSSVAVHDPLRLEQIIDAEHPNLILLDVVMPHRNGFQACRELKGNADYARIPVVMVTSKSTESDKFWGKEQGADGYVVKPFTSEDLLVAVRKLVGKQKESGQKESGQGQKETGQKESGQKESGQKESGQKEIGQKEIG